MDDTQKKTLTLKRKPATSAPDASSPSVATPRSGKRIIRREELDNLQRPGKKKFPARETKPPRKPANTRQVAMSPSDLKARELNERLNGFPVWRDFLPLAIGIDKDIFRLVSEEQFPGASKKVVQKTLAMHVKHGRYLNTLIEGGARYRLDGTEEGEITDYQRQHAAEIMAKRQPMQE